MKKILSLLILDKMLEKKQIYALVCICMLSPLVKTLTHDDGDLTRDDHRYIDQFVRFGNLIIFVILVAVAAWIAMFFTRWYFLSYIVYFLSIAAIVMMGYGFFMNFREKTVQYDNGFDTRYLTYMIPGYNFYLWPRRTSDTVWWLKETTYWVIVGGFLLIIYPPAVIYFLLLWLSRIVSLALGVDLIPDALKKHMHYWYKNHPEEMLAPVVKFFIDLFDRGRSTLYYKEKYTKDYDLRTKRTDLIVGYVCMAVVRGYVLTRFPLSSPEGVAYIFVWMLVISRYIIGVIRGKAPYIPLVGDIIERITRKEKDTTPREKLPEEK